MEQEGRNLTAGEYAKQLIKQINKPSDIVEIKRSIPIVKNLHPSFWTDKKFLSWQVIRLDSNYQKFIVDFWEGNLQKKPRLTGLDFFFKDFPPLPKESIKDWMERLDDESSRASESLRSFFMISMHGYFANRTPTPWPLSIFEFFLKWLSLTCQPIPYQVRFPLPILLNESHFPTERMFGKKGHPIDWALNLLIYELSQAGIKDAGIARLLRASANDLLFGVVKSYNGSTDKDPFLVRINTIKKTVKKALSQIDLLFP